MFDLSGRRALVTGASRGIGREVAVALAKAGADVAAMGRDLEALADTVRLVQAEGRIGMPAAADVRRRGDMEAAARRLAGDFGDIDILVVNAGINRVKPFLDVQADDWQAVVETNLLGAFNTLQVFGRGMTQRGRGSVINMASIYSFAGAPDNAIYCMSKGGLLQLTKALAIEWARHQVRVNAIHPGWIETELSLPFQQDQRLMDAVLRRIPLRRLGRTQDVAPLAVYLASDEAQWVTGQSFVVDGGRLTY